MKQLKEIRKAFPNQEIVELNNGTGCNIHFDKATISVWFKKKKYGNADGWHKYGHLDDFIADMDRYITRRQRVAPVEAEAIEIGNRVQEVIDHIQKKRELIMKHQPDNKLATFCMTLCDELKQFL